jgi:hypothetical protein
MSTRTKLGLPALLKRLSRVLAVTAKSRERCSR